MMDTMSRPMNIESHRKQAAGDRIIRALRALPPGPRMISCAFCAATIHVMPSGDRLELDGSPHAPNCLA